MKKLVFPLTQLLCVHSVGVGPGLVKGYRRGGGDVVYPVLGADRGTHLEEKMKSRWEVNKIQGGCFSTTHKLVNSKITAVFIKIITYTYPVNIARVDQHFEVLGLVRV